MPVEPDLVRATLLCSARVAFLASEKSTYATGASFVVDGGLTLMAAELSS
ncbi:MAG TPA: hypothetical protein VK902_01135 [Rubrobacter sp.]|jgi:NAD(P)-dependent dehydrogenase (short-subunit alcohol dehydrogenase family)|nr:hypothetical protein [Rubrobacter sp.]